jgi:hypothetical protein
VHAVSLTPLAIFAFENRSYLGEFEAEFKKALARELGAQWVLFEEKTEGQKSCDTVPLKCFSASCHLEFYDQLIFISHKYGPHFFLSLKTRFFLISFIWGILPELGIRYFLPFSLFANLLLQ